MSELRKTLYCTVCKTYPDELETESATITKRRWNGVCYENLHSQVIPDADIHTCWTCGNLLEERS